MPDYSKGFIIHTDASDLGIGGILVQGEGDEERVIAYMSQKLSSAERKYQTTERECLAVISAIEKFRAYVEGVKFTVVTDHASLLWLKNLKDPAGRLGRWALRLQAYDFNFVHRKGSQMVVADALSRAINAIDLTSFSQTDDSWYLLLKKGIEEKPEKYQKFRIENNVIYKHCQIGTKNHGFTASWRIIIPKSHRQEVLKQCHDDPLSAHGGYFKTIDRVRREYFWPKMDEDVRKYVNQCRVCLASKASNVNQVAPMGKQRESTRPWQMLYLDFISPLPRSKNGFTFILTVLDSFSKFVHIHPLRAATAASLIKFLEDRIFLTFGVPEVIIADNGSQFTSGMFKKFLELYKVKLWLTPIYHAQCNRSCQ